MCECHEREPNCQTGPPYKSRVFAIPPSAQSVFPVTKRAASDAKNTTTPAMSSGVAVEPERVGHYAVVEAGSRTILLWT